jgi:lysophospholipase
LRYLRKRPGLFAKTILCAPMLDINTAPMPKYLARLFSRWLRRAGFGRAKIVGAGYFDPYGHDFEHNQLTSDTRRFHHMQQTIAGNPALVASHVTNGWLAAAFDSIDILHGPGFNRGIHTPMLIAMAGRDRIVVNQATLQFAAHLPYCKTLAIEGSRHEILQERDVLRSRFWEAFEGFVAVRETHCQASSTLTFNPLLSQA